MSLKLKLCVQSCLMSLLSGTVFAQIPPDGSLPLSSGSMAISQSGQYASAAPYAALNVTAMINEGNAFAPYSEEYLEISTPNSQPILVNIAGDCIRYGNRGIDCHFHYPLSTADMADPNVTLTSRYYIKKNNILYEAYLKKTGVVSGQTGSIGNSSSSGSGSVQIPAISQIPPHNSVAADTAYSVTITPSSSQYSPTSRNMQLQINVEPASQSGNAVAPPYVNEIIEFKSDSSSVFYVNIGTQCTRYGTGLKSLNCSVPFNLPASDAAEPVRTLTARYYADALIPNSQLIWTGYSLGSALISNSQSQGSGNNTPLCNPESTPLMPTQTSPGVFVFDIPSSDLCPGEFWIDPPVAVGYRYEIAGAHFAKVTMPSLQSVNDADGYMVNNPLGVSGMSGVAAGQGHNFSNPTTVFDVFGINPALELDPNDDQAFQVGLELTPPTGAQVSITQTSHKEEYPPLSYNQKPIADGGTFLSVIGNNSIQLSGSPSTDADGDLLTYKWIQIAGPSVTVLGSTQIVNPEATMPAIGPSPQYVVFELVVNDGALDSNPAQIVVQTR